MLASWLSFHGSTEDPKWAHTKVNKNCLLYASLSTRSLPAQGNFTSIKSEYDNSKGLIQFYSQLFMNILLLKPETRNHMSNQWFLAEIQPGAAPLMIITRRLNTYNIILNFTIQLGSLYYRNSCALISIKSSCAPSHRFLSLIFSGAIYIMVQG